MKYILPAAKNDREEEEEVYPEKLLINYNKIKATFQTTPTEIIYNIIFFCGIIEKHALRFVCKQFHQIVHKCGSEEGNFFFIDKDRRETEEWKPSFFDEARIVYEITVVTLAIKLGYLDILKWMIQCFPEILDPRNESYCYLAALNGHLEILKWARKNKCR
jgi:hypothetical protein